MRESSKFVHVESLTEEKFVQIVAQPFHMPLQKKMILIHFHEILTNELFLNTSALPALSENSVISNLSTQLQESRDAMKSISDELLFSKQNMATINEELQNSNEKLQSTVEELETSNEELQSSNGELIASLSSNRELQNRLSLILESSVNGIIGLDMQGHYTFVNEKAAQLLGYSAEYLIEKDSHRICHHTKADGSYYPLEECPIVNTLQRGEVSRGADLFWRKDGTSFPVELVRSPIREEGVITGAVISFHDITKEEILTHELEVNNLKYEQTFQAAQIGIAHVGLNGAWLDVNQYLCRLVGYTKEELLGLTFQDITHAEDLEKDAEYVQSLLENKITSYQMEKRYIRKNGNVVWVNLSAVVVRNDSNEPLYFISVVQDISQIKMLISDLQRKKNEIESAIRFAPNPILLYDEDGMILLINEAFQDITGYTIKDIPTIDVWNQKILGGEKIADISDVDKLFEKNQREDIGAKKIITKDGTVVLWACSLAPLGNVYSSKRVLISSAMDITDIHKKEELMLSQSRQAAMGDMIGMIAHQWRQPLSVIAMVANNLRASMELSEEIVQADIYKLIDVLSEQTQYLSRTIDDFRTFFKPEKTKEKIVLCRIYEKLQSMMQKILENNQITLTLVNDCNIEFYTYPNELIQVMLNVVNNAKDAIKERKIENARIEIDTSVVNNLLRISISDNAGGIDKSVIERLGEPYVTTKSTNGTGLGIYMSLMIIEKHFGGTLHWKNINGGSCFTIELPLKNLEENNK